MMKPDRRVTIRAALLRALWTPVAQAGEITNPGFEDGWTGWSDGDPTGTATALSDVAHTGTSAVKLTEDKAFVAQTVAVEPGATYRLSAFVRGPGTLGAKAGPEMFFEQQPKRGKQWREIAVTFATGEANSVSIFATSGGVEVRFDDFRLDVLEDGDAAVSKRILNASGGGFGLSPDLSPGKNFGLLGWYLSTPGDDDNNGLSDRISEVELAKGATDSRYFYTTEDGGMVFRATVAGAKTSANTRFTRTELREMLRRGDTSISTKTDDKAPNRNNWVLSSAPAQAQRAAGGIDGLLRATLAVNHVTTTGHKSHIGRVVIGQIHAAVDEPIRLYYRKLPGNSRGAIYAAHEVSNGDDIYFELLGSRRDSAADPENGIALDEKFSYEIETQGNWLQVRILKDGNILAAETIDMTDSGYDIAKDYMYFKAGVYNQNHSGEPDDYVQATFYELVAGHSDYAP